MQLLLLPDEHTITIVTTAMLPAISCAIIGRETLILCVSGALALVAACTISHLNPHSARETTYSQVSTLESKENGRKSNEINLENP